MAAIAGDPGKERRRRAIAYVTGGSSRRPRLVAYVLAALAAGGLAGIGLVLFLRGEPTSEFDGFVYVESNTALKGQNRILAFRFRRSRLEPLGEFPTGGMGTIDRGIEGSLDAEGQIAVDRSRRLLFAVNQGSDTLAVFRIGRDGRLSPAAGSPFPAGGRAPASIGLAGDLLVVANKAQDPNRDLGSARPALTTFRVASSGTLTPTGRSTRLPADTSPTQALVLSGRVVAGTLETGPFVSYALGQDGSLARAPGSPLEPEPSIFDPGYQGARWAIGLVPHPTRPLLYADQSASHQLLVYAYEPTGKLRFVQAVNNSGARLPCWTTVSRDGRFLYTANAGNGSVSAFSLADPAKPRHLQTLGLRRGANPWGLALDPSGKTLFVVDPNAVEGVPSALGNRLHVLTVGSSGRLTEIDAARKRLPVGRDSSPLGIAVVPRS